MRRDQAFDRLAAILLGRHATAGKHIFERTQKLLGDLQIFRVAGVVEGHQDFVGEPATMAGGHAHTACLGQLNIAFGRITHQRSMLPYLRASAGSHQRAPQVYDITCVGKMNNS